MKRIVIIWMFIIIILVLGIAIISIPKIKEYNDRLALIKSLQYEAIEYDDMYYYPTSMSLMSIPCSLPPCCPKTVYRIINGKTDHNHKYSAEMFVDDYYEDFLYIDGIVFRNNLYNYGKPH